ncbi:hypothetical protein ScPMuIL_013925 [Solemya velum]
MASVARMVCRGRLLCSKRPQTCNLTQIRTIKIGDRVPAVNLYENTPDNPVNLQDLYKDKKGVLFAVVGAFTPGCSQTHLPEYIDHFESFQKEGFELISCVAVNDPFVMAAWSQYAGAGGKIKMLADPKGDFTRAMDMELKSEKYLGTNRSRRYSIVIEDGIVQSINVDPDHTGLACLLCIKNTRYTKDGFVQQN